MSQFRGHAKSLSELYVFYQRLNTDGFYPTLGKYVRYASFRILDQTERYAGESESVYRMARAEFQKEKNLLSEKFGVVLNLDYYDEYQQGRGFKEVVDALNSTLNLKDVYERNKILIKETKGQKGVYSWLPTYFMKAWEERVQDLQEKWTEEFKKVGDSTIALEKVLDTELPEILKLGIEKMLDGPEVENSKVPPELRNAYSSLVSEIGKVSTAGSVANQLYKAYQLEDLKQSLLKELAQSVTIQSFTGKVDKAIKANIHYRGGLTLEAIETAIFQQISKGVNGKAYHTGDIGIKADNILTLDIDTELIQNAFDNAGGSREKNIKALSELGEKISKLNQGFIIYSSDKNYTLNSDFSGFSSGNEEKIAPFLTRIYKNDSSLNTLIGAINQLGEGAMLEDKEGAFERLLAQDVAYMLFDDYTTIGEADMGGRSIHVMNLNGVMIPLSMILHLLGEAIDAAYIDKNFIKKIVNVDIKVPPIEFKTHQEQLAWQEQHPEENAWDFQRQETLLKSTIHAKFLSSFRRIVQEFL